MPLEATIMVLDNSEFMRNGDYPPTRFEAQSDAVTTISRSKIDSNPENTVGVMTAAGKGPQVLVTHTKELGQVLGGIHTTAQQITGELDIPTALNIAQLALKHRQNKNLRQRIILFVGSPLGGTGADEKTLVRLAKKLKKNNVAVDIILFGDEEGREANEPLLKAFVDNVVSGDNSHFLSVPPGTRIISDALLSSPILREDLPAGMDDAGAVATAGQAGGSGGFEFDVDPSLDPELAMALRMSLEEERARQAAAASASNPQASSSSALPSIPESTTTPQQPGVSTTTPTSTAVAAVGATVQPSSSSSTSAAATTAPPPPKDGDGIGIDDDDEEALLARALAMSREDNKNDTPVEDVEMGDGDDLSEEEAIAAAIAMSLDQDANAGDQENSGSRAGK